MELPFSALDLAISGTASASFVAFLIVHVVVIRYQQPSNSLKALTDVFVLCLVLDLALGWFVLRFAPEVSRSQTPATLLASGAVSVFIYSALAFAFVVGVYFLGETARRIRLLREIHRVQAKALTLDEILEVYNADVILTLRLSRLVRSGQLKFDGRQYRVGARFFLVQARTLWFLRRLFRFPDDRL